MEPNERIEKLINSTIENLPPPFMIFGKKKEMNPLEDFWMAKLESIEKQYNEHIVKLERSVLDNRVSRRHIYHKDERIIRLKGDLNEKTSKVQDLSKQTTQLQKKLSHQKYKADSLQKRLSNTEEVKSKVLKSLEDERHGRIQREKEIARLKLKLTQLERDKKFLTHEISIKDGEKSRVEEREDKLAQNKWTLIKNITEIDQERRVQTDTNVQLVDTIGHLLDVGKSQEFKLLRQRKEIDMILEGMKQKRKEHEEALRKLGLREKDILDLVGERKYSEEKVQHLQRQVRHWKEELELKELDNDQSRLDMKSLQRENSNLRCELAEYREKLNKNSSQLKSLESEKRRTEIELQKAKGQAQSVHLMMCRNELIKQRLAEKILKAHPSIKMTLDQRARESIRRGDKKKLQTETVPTQEIQSYKKKIWALESQKKDLERHIIDSKRKQSRLKTKLDRYTGMEEQILWTEKAMVKLEGDRNRMEDLMKTMALNVPKKLPFEKLVTDPSILDRMAKYQVLQKRLLLQSTKVEEMKRNAMKILEYRKRKSEEEFADKRGELAPWKLSHWKQTSEDTLADLDNQLELEPEGTTLPERKYYKDYISYLNTEIPSVKQQIALLERRQHYKQQQLLDAERSTSIKRHAKEDSFDSGTGGVILQKLPSTEEALLETVLEDEENEEEDIDEELVNEDSDIDGLIGVVSIDELSSDVRELSQIHERSGKDQQGVLNKIEDLEKNDNIDIGGAEQTSDSEYYEDEDEVDIDSVTSNNEHEDKSQENGNK